MAADPSPTPPARDHRQITDDLDAVYVAALDAVTYSQRFLTQRHGNPYEVYNVLSEGFGKLYVHTRANRRMITEYKNLLFAVDRWTKKSTRNHNVISLIREGLYLFKYYQIAVVMTGAVVIKRE